MRNPDEVATSLADRFGETRLMKGIAANGALVELYASARTGTWTLTATFANGLTCLVGSGDHFDPSATTAQPAGELL